jgi:hypothetical protein
VTYQLTNEVIEMWEQEASAGHCDSTAANARILRLIAEVRGDSDHIAELTGRLYELDPGFRARIDEALNTQRGAA